MEQLDAPTRYARHEIASFGLVAIAGLSFWFVLGFPFANHNESYLWIVELHEHSFFDVLTEKLDAVATLRPLGQATAWIGYWIFGGSLYPVQAFNYIVTIAAWILLSRAVEEKRVFAIVALATGALFFSGYIFVFHLQGVFYGPLLLLIALLAVQQEKVPTGSSLTRLSIVALLCSLFHPFGALIYIAYSIGLLFEGRLNLSKKQYLIVGSVWLLLLGILATGSADQGSLLTPSRLAGLVASYRMVEVNAIGSGAALLFGLLTIAITGAWSIQHRLALSAVVSLVSLTLFVVGLPVTAAWILACLYKGLRMQKLALTALIVATSLLPLVGGSGSPTYSIFVLMVCAVVTPLGSSGLDRKLRIVGSRLALVIWALVVTTALALRLGVDVPVAAGLTRPVLAEREKTFQLEGLLDWMKESEYADYDVYLGQAIANPKRSESALDRTGRPPTYQSYLSAYLDWLRRQKGGSGKGLEVYFGSAAPPAASLVYSANGRYAGDMTVHLRPQ